MKGLISNYLLAALLGILLSQIVNGEEYLYVNFTGNVTANYSAIYALGENGTNYIVDGNTVIFRSMTDLDRPVAITQGDTLVIEMAQMTREGVMPNIEWMAANGVINGIESEYYEQIGSGIDHMMVFSTDKVELDGPFGKLGRRIAPMEYANGTRLEYVNTVALPPEGLGDMAGISAARAPTPFMPENGAAEAPATEIYGIGENAPDGMPTSAPDAQKSAPDGSEGTRIGAAATGYGAGQEANDAALGTNAEEKQTDFGFLPIVAGVMLIAIAAMLMLRQGTVTVLEEQPEVRMALSNETRVAIMADLAETERIPTDISMRIGKSKATISEHLEQLVGAGLVEKVQTPGRKFVYYRLSHKGRGVLLRRKFAA